MIRRLVVTWLIVSILGYGMAAIADAHQELETDRTHIISDHGTSPNDADDESNCDHCCHGIIHLLGLNSVEASGLAADSGIILVPYSVSLISFSPPSLLRPPITI